MLLAVNRHPEQAQMESTRNQSRSWFGSVRFGDILGLGVPGALAKHSRG